MFLAGIQWFSVWQMDVKEKAKTLDSRLRGNDEAEDCCLCGLSLE
jgi:hypothetical protein